ncbi:MAG: hypothetical protein M0C28_13545 [Candidatus Moduliflexus flocculans]|nr:hypothetical protein [Candidatus Moduliflexus flocculans]
MMDGVLASDWGRLFQNWETRRRRPTPTATRTSGARRAEISRMGAKAFAKSFGVLGTCVMEAPEFANRKRKVVGNPG